MATGKTTRTASVPFRGARHLRGDAEIAAYIEEMLSEGDPSARSVIPGSGGVADPLSLVGATAPLGAGLLAACVPARRASQIDPAVVLREE